VTGIFYGNSYCLRGTQTFIHCPVPTSRCIIVKVKLNVVIETPRFLKSWLLYRCSAAKFMKSTNYNYYTTKHICHREWNNTLFWIFDNFSVLFLLTTELSSKLLCFYGLVFRSIMTWSAEWRGRVYKDRSTINGEVVPCYKARTLGRQICVINKISPYFFVHTILIVNIEYAWLTSHRFWYHINYLISMPRMNMSKRGSSGRNYIRRQLFVTYGETKCPNLGIFTAVLQVRESARDWLPLL
jgi:hypothetical protein